MSNNFRLNNSSSLLLKFTKQWPLSDFFHLTVNLVRVVSLHRKWFLRMSLTLQPLRLKLRLQERMELSMLSGNTTRRVFSNCNKFYCNKNST
mmetsp:Transcript_48470/g.113835  ORF Transcript_48470/g.113835 Transcript_48470/m.113835 type:complete len:92 (+) Transcript_48470:134-409(+)